MIAGVRYSFVPKRTANCVGLGYTGAINDEGKSWTFSLLQNPQYPIFNDSTIRNFFSISKK